LDIDSLKAQSIQITGAIDSRLISAKRSLAARLKIFPVTDRSLSFKTI